ncbi:MAG: pyridoxamine kinase [Clostridia bacterium]|nr:pyridoxamine kinase [Clostridia bacterium]
MKKENEKANKIKRVMAIHDIACYGKSSLTVVLPAMSALGAEVVPLPTALLSSHTGIKNATFLPLDKEMHAILNHWESEKVDFDCIYSGFLGSADQIDTVLSVFEKYPSAFKAVDPVMGDNGVKYKTYTDEMCEKMVRLVTKADIITPNYTEACMLLNMPYEEFPDLSKVETAARKLCELGPRTAVITGVREGDNIINVAYDRKEGVFTGSCKYVKRRYDGTGDLFSSVFFGLMLENGDVKASLSRASEFIRDVVKYTAENSENDIILFEPLLWKIKEQ